MKIRALKISALKTSVLLALCLILSACYQKAETKIEKVADKIYFNGNIYTANTLQPLVAAVATKDGRILAVGSQESLTAYKSKTTAMVDLQGNTMLPGFIEGHGHFVGTGISLMQLNLYTATSYRQLLAEVEQAVANSKPGQWIIGRGWHQSKWDKTVGFVKGFPTNELLDNIAPNNPVYLTHASGHAGLANSKALELAEISKATEVVKGGEVVKNAAGELTGILNERAEDLIQPLIDAELSKLKQQAVAKVVAYSLANGITSFHDAGSSSDDLKLIKTAAEQGELKVRLYAMLSSYEPDLLAKWYKQGPEIGSFNNHLTIRSIKINADGALGSRGAWLLEEYSDMPGNFGTATQPMQFVYDLAMQGLQHNFQVNTHAIGDRANREILDQYQRAFKEMPKASTNHRFRIEHAQHIDPADVGRFARLGVIASVQAIHMSSDRPWAIHRLGKHRIESGAYIWRKLIDSGALVINGSDVPVEPINPIASFYASVTRKTLNGTPAGGYEPSQKMTRLEALRSYTINSAYAAFEEDIKGSIEVGKFADFVILDTNIITVGEDKLLETNVLKTIVGDKEVFKLY